MLTVVIGNKIGNIDNETFAGSSNLMTVTMGNRVETIGASAFSNCTNLASVSLGTRVASIIPQRLQELHRSNVDNQSKPGSSVRG